jgi:hypothetical protein
MRLKAWGNKKKAKKKSGGKKEEKREEARSRTKQAKQKGKG